MNLLFNDLILEDHEMDALGRKPMVMDCPDQAKSKRCQQVAGEVGLNIAVRVCIAMLFSDWRNQVAYMLWEHVVIVQINRRRPNITDSGEIG